MRLPFPRFTFGRAWLVVALLPLLAVCRDAPDLFEPPEPAPLGPAPYRLTFSPDRDATPAWSADADTVYYLSHLPGIGASSGDTDGLTAVLFKIPAAGGTAVRALPVLQPDGTTLSIVDFAVAHDGRIATYIPASFAGPLCGVAVPFCAVPLSSTPVLREAYVRVSMPAGSNLTATDVRVTVSYRGRRFDTSENPEGLAGIHITELFPFQRLFNEAGHAPSGLSWSPDETRLALSDGLGVLLWTPSTGDTVRVPKSTDGIDPAWSPSGDWIAFERLERGTEKQQECVYRVGDMVQCVERRIEYALPRRRLAIVRPGGEVLRILPEGTRPAWSHDGRRIYYEHEGSVWMVGIDGTGEAPVPGTEHGSEPVSSPDGRHIAFTRTDPETGEADIWIVEAPP